MSAFSRCASSPPVVCALQAPSGLLLMGPRRHLRPSVLNRPPARPVRSTNSGLPNVVSTTQVGSGQRRLTQVRAVEVGALQYGISMPGQLGAAQVRPRLMPSKFVRRTGVRRFQVSAQRCADQLVPGLHPEIDFTQVGLPPASESRRRAGLPSATSPEAIARQVCPSQIAVFDG
jgi:hypothetical protein